MLCEDPLCPVDWFFAVCTPLLITVLSPLQKNMWLVTPAAPQRPSCRRTLASISCSVKRATPAALSPASRLASRPWRAREHSSAPKPTKDVGARAAPPLTQETDARLIHWKDSMNRTVGGFGCCFSCSCCGLTKQGVEVVLTDRIQTQKRVNCTKRCWIHFLFGSGTLSLISFNFAFAVILESHKETKMYLTRSSHQLFCSTQTAKL